MTSLLEIWTCIIDALCKLDDGGEGSPAIAPEILDVFDGFRGVGKPQEEGGDADGSKYSP